MSSTNRGGSRHASDYYATPVSDIKDFLDAYHVRYGRLPGPILDPCAGGSDGVAMSYPVALEAEGYQGTHTLDIRPDSPAAEIGDYRERERERWGTIITNPPFYIAQEIAEKALAEADVVIMLQRLNWLGSHKRRKFWAAHMPSDVFVHHKRISFTGGKTDSIEYAHFVWRPDMTGTLLHIV